jgi:ABC-type polysaccharide/polyol phosphate export permease
MGVGASLRSLWEHRSYVLAGAVREVRQRYAGSGMGVVWHVLIPLVQIAVYFVVFSRFMGARDATYTARTYGLFLCAGILPWFAFQDALARGAAALVANENYLKKLAIPEAVFVAQTVATSTLSLGLYLLALYGLAVAGGVPVRATWLLVPVVLVLVLAMGFGHALLLAPLCVFFRDVIQLVPIVLQVWFWLTPVVYARTSVGPLLQKVVAWNPPGAYLGAVRELLVSGTWPLFGEWAFMVALAVGLPWAGLAFLSRVSSDLRDAL